MEKTPPEAPGVPSHTEGQKSPSLFQRVISRTRKVLSKLFADDPEVAAILTPEFLEFLEKFGTDFRQMLAERRRGASSFAESLHADSVDMLYGTFDALVRDHHKTLGNLTGRTRSIVMSRLMDTCGILPPG